MYDEECPICTVYSRTLVNKGMLEEKGRMAYQSAEGPSCQRVNMQRAADEIALVNNETGEVEYGIGGLLRIFSYSYPRMGRILKTGPVLWMLKIAYALIAFNRRVILPPKKVQVPFAVQPTFSLPYRLAYLLLTWVVSGFIFLHFRRLIFPYTGWANLFFEWQVIAGLIVFQGIVAKMTITKEVWGYLGNLMTVTLCGSLLVIPLLIVSIWVQVPLGVHIAYAVLVLLLMFIWHLRRLRQWDRTAILWLTWLLYWAGVWMYYWMIYRVTFIFTVI